MPKMVRDVEVCDEDWNEEIRDGEDDDAKGEGREHSEGEKARAQSRISARIIGSDEPGYHAPEPDIEEFHVAYRGKDERPEPEDREADVIEGVGREKETNDQDDELAGNADH